MAELNHYEKLVDMLRRPAMYKDIPMLSEIADDIEGLLAACDNYSDALKDTVDELEKVERKHGKWNDKAVAFYLKCSECGCCVRSFVGEVFLDYMQGWNYCPNCGADNRESEGEDG